VRGRRFYFGGKPRGYKPVGAKDVAQRIVGDPRQISRLSITHFLADGGFPFSQSGRHFRPGLPALLVRPPVGGEEYAGRGHEHHQNGRDRSGQ
jgi:hypothetical protein